MYRAVIPSKLVVLRSNRLLSRNLDSGYAPVSSRLVSLAKSIHEIPPLTIL